MGGVHDGFSRVGHVGDDAVRQDQQNEIFLIGGMWAVEERRAG